MKLVGLWRVLRHYLNHPLGRLDRLGTLSRFIHWQIGSRVLGAPVAMPVADGIQLLVRTGMRGATGNIYVGLMEFEDMAFAMHLMRQGDMFLDIGANIGIYSLLAASRGASVKAFEPVTATYEQLLDNVSLNRFHVLIDARNMGVGGQSGELRFSSRSGPTNHVLAEGETDDNAVTVAVEALDEISIEATMMKIDVEGFEAEVIRGGRRVLQLESLQAVLIELNGLGARYGFADADIHAKLLDFGFSPVRYDPFARRMMPLDTHNTSGNTLYVRHSADLDRRLREARPIVWNEIEV